MSTSISKGAPAAIVLAANSVPAITRPLGGRDGDLERCQRLPPRPLQGDPKVSSSVRMISTTASSSAGFARAESGMSSSMSSGLIPSTSATAILTLDFTSPASTRCAASDGGRDFSSSLLFERHPPPSKPSTARARQMLEPLSTSPGCPRSAFVTSPRGATPDQRAAPHFVQPLSSRRAGNGSSMMGGAQQPQVRIASEKRLTRAELPNATSMLRTCRRTAAPRRAGCGTERTALSARTAAIPC